jgi:hypothetical protein
MLMRVWCDSLVLRMVAGLDSVAMSGNEQGKEKEKKR